MSPARPLGITKRTLKAPWAGVFREVGVLGRMSAAFWACEHLPDAWLWFGDWP